MPTDHLWTCDCGEMQIRADLTRAARVVCYCRDCRAMARHLDHEALLNAAGGIEAVQTLPERLHFIRGKDRIACVNMTGRDRLRWYAGCCKTPLGTTLQSRFIPYISVLSTGFTGIDALGPVQAHVNRRHARARIDGDTGSTKRMLAGMALRAITSFATLGPWRSPFRQRDGSPVARVHHLSDTERARAYDPPAES